MTTSSELVTLNDWSDYWFYQIGVNVIAADTKRKVTYEKWEQWENTAMSDELHEEHKQKGDYNKGIAVIPGLLWRGPHKGMYLVAIDLDNKKTIEEFCKDGLERLKEVTLVEQNSNPDKMHLYFIVEKEIANKASDKTDISKSSMVNTNEIPAIEVKSNGKGIMFCSNSPHKDGGNYEIKGTVKPNVFNAQDVETRIKNICNKFGLYYGSSNNGRNSNNSNSTGGGIGDNNNNDSYLISIQELFTPGTKILEGHNRHLAILRVMESLLLKNMGFLKLEEIKRLAEERNQDLCIPPLEKSDIDRQWKCALNFAERKNREREEEKRKQQQEQDQNRKNDSNNNNNTNATKTTRSEEKQQVIEQGTEILMSKYTFLTIEESKDILYYNKEKGVYEYGGEIIIDKDLEEIFGLKLRSADIAEIIGHIQRRTYVKKERFDSDFEIINVENCLLNWKTGQRMDHTPDYLSLNQKPIIYDPNAIPWKFLKFLREVLYVQDIRTALEIIAYSFIKKNLFDYYFILIGVGANGKNVFVGIISHLHGLKNISNVSLKSLLKNRFALAQLENKDINVDTELSSSFVNDMSILKKLTGSQPIMLERKGKDPYEVELWAKHFFNANELPLTSDNSDAHYRRQVILSFPNQFEDGINADPELLNKIVKDPKEMSGILNLVINSLRVIDKNKKIHVNSTITERRAKAQLIADPVGAFVEKYCIKSGDHEKIFETKDNLHDAFITFCKSKKLHILKYDQFAKILKNEHGYENERRYINKKRVTIWFLKLTEQPAAAIDDDEDDDQHGNE